MFPPSARGNELEPALSGKMKVLDCLLAATKAAGNDKFVLVSNYTETLDAIEKLINMRHYSYVRLDGKMPAKKRAQIVATFNKPEVNAYRFEVHMHFIEFRIHLHVVVEGRRMWSQLNWRKSTRNVRSGLESGKRRSGNGTRLAWRTEEALLYLSTACGTNDAICYRGIVFSMFRRAVSKRKCFNVKRIRRRWVRALSTRRTMWFDISASISCVIYFSYIRIRAAIRMISMCIRLYIIVICRMRCTRCMNGVESREPPDTADTGSDLSLWYHSQRDYRKIPDQTLKSIWNSGAISFVFHQRSHDRHCEWDRCWFAIYFFLIIYCAEWKERIGDGVEYYYVSRTIECMNDLCWYEKRWVICKHESSSIVWIV